MDGSQNLNIFFGMIAIALLFFVPLIHEAYSSKVGFVQTSDEINDPIKKWLEHFSTVQLTYASKGEKALANPFDDAKHGIPNNQELVILLREIKNLGFAAHINSSFSNDRTPHHLTVVWE